MDKNGRRKILCEKSIYKRQWTFADEVQFKWISFMLGKNGLLKCKNVRPNVMRMLQKHGKNVEQIGDAKWEVF